MEINNKDGLAKVIAFYLPQFYPNAFNDKWYGKGFTEWTNVGKAKPLFRGHYQPHVPADLGYYDLRVPEVAKQQAELAREAGVFGFAYWHYWWDGKKLLNEPAERIISTGEPDYPFMFAWANENWYKKLWNKDKSDDKLIMEQTYPGKEDNLAHFEYCLPFFRDKRYITFDGKPIFLIYLPLHFKEVTAFMKQWNKLIKESGVAESFYFVGMQYSPTEINTLKDLGFDCITPQHNLRTPIAWETAWGRFKAGLNRYIGEYMHIIRSLDYSRYPQTVWKEEIDSREDIAPQLIPNWDNTPRAGRRGMVYKNSTPEIFGEAAGIVMRSIKKKNNKLVFLKSWNEWAEGNYMEPDLMYGKGYIEALHEAINNNRE